MRRSYCKYSIEVGIRWRDPQRGDGLHLNKRLTLLKTQESRFCFQLQKLVVVGVSDTRTCWNSQSVCLIQCGLTHEHLSEQKLTNITKVDPFIVGIKYSSVKLCPEMHRILCKLKLCYFSSNYTLVLMKCLPLKHKVSNIY